MRDEILEQPAVAAGLLETGLPVIEAIARAIRSGGPLVGPGRHDPVAGQGGELG